jgi:hypothetical protein
MNVKHNENFNLVEPNSLESPNISKVRLNIKTANLVKSNRFNNNCWKN